MTLPSSPPTPHKKGRQTLSMRTSILSWKTENEIFLLQHSLRGSLVVSEYFNALKYIIQTIWVHQRKLLQHLLRSFVFQNEHFIRL